MVVVAVVDVVGFVVVVVDVVGFVVVVVVVVVVVGGSGIVMRVNVAVIVRWMLMVLL